MDSNIRTAIGTALQAYKSNQTLYQSALNIYQHSNITCIWHGVNEDGFLIDLPGSENVEVTMRFPEDELIMPDEADEIFVALLMWYYNEYKIESLPEMQGKIYTREGMMARVISREKREKAINEFIELSLVSIIMVNILCIIKKRKVWHHTLES